MTEDNLATELRDLVRAIVADLPTSPSSTTSTLDAALWSTLARSGLTRLTGPERRGGSGAGWLEAATVLGELARNAVPHPLLEHDLLAGWLRDTVGLAATPTDAVATGMLIEPHATSNEVAWLPSAETVVVLDTSGGRALAFELPVAELASTPGHTLAGTPAGRVVAISPPAGAIEVDPILAEEWRHRGALARAIEMAASMEAVAEMCCQHASTRVQFGRPLARFQAVQHLVTAVAGEAALGRAIVDRAVAAVATDGFADPQTRFLVAAAKACTGGSAATVVRSAHQLHGALGTTLEHPLQHYTRSLLSHRREYGATRAWERRIEADASRVGGNLWKLVSA